MEQPVWQGSSTFNPGQTPLQLFDTDPIFQNDADKVARFCAIRLGYPQMDVELSSGSFYACFEEAVSTYGNEIYHYKIRDNYLSIEGSPKDTPLNNRVIDPSLSRLVELSKNYGTEVDVGGKVTKHTGLLPLHVGTQEYDLDQWAIDEGITGGIEIRRIFYQATPAMLRYFDPYAGTGYGVQSLMDAFGFGGMSPGVSFMLMPASFDLMKIQAIEFNDQIRKSAYTFELVNNQLRVFPRPKTEGTLVFEYMKITDKYGNHISSSTGSISNVGEVPYEEVVYSHINSPGKQWIRNYTLALAKENLAYVRGKYQSLPVPGAETTLNQADLLADARTEKEALLTQLRDMLDNTSRQAQLERKANETEFMSRTLINVPMVIYVG